jgi:hypothetical protein
MRLHGDDRWILAVAILVLAPLGVMLINLVGTHWFPASDQALEVLRIGDVGSRRTPLVGVQSRFGWDHPGPLLFWWSAPFRWVFGNTGVLFGIGLLNGAAITGSVLVARRRGGLPLVVAFAVVFLTLLQGLGIDLLVDPWNPWVAVVPFLLYLLLAWSLAERDYALLPWLVAVGTFLVQTHVGYAPLVGGITVVAIALAAFGHPPVAEASTPSTLRRDLRRALVVGVVLWLPALIEQVTGSPGNLGEIFDFFRNPTEPTSGWSTSLRIMANELRLPGAWITGDDLGRLGIGLSRSPFGALLLLGGVAALGFFAYRRGERGAARLAAIALAVSALGIVAGSRIVGLLGPYLVRWWWVIVALVWLSILWSAWAFVAPTRAARPVLAAAAVAIVALSLVGVRDGASGDVPLARESAAVAALAPDIERALDPDRTYLLNWAETRTWSSVAVGVYLALHDAGFDVKVPPTLEHAWGSGRTALDHEVDEKVIVVADENRALGWEPPAGAVEIAHHDPLTQAQRARATQLDAELRAFLEPDERAAIITVESRFTRAKLRALGADPDSVDELAELNGPGQAFTVYLAPAPVADA